MRGIIKMTFEEITFIPFEYPKFVKKGSLKPIIKKIPEIWGTGRGKSSSNSFRIDRLKVGVVKTSDLFDLKDKYEMTDIFEGIRILVNDRVVKKFPNESKLGRSDYQIIGEIFSQDLKRFEKSTHNGFRKVEPTLKDKIREITQMIKIAFNKEIEGLKTLGGKDTMTEDILNFLEEVGLGDIVDVVAEEGKKEEHESENNKVGIKIKPPRARYIKNIKYTPAIIRDQTTDFRISIEIQNISNEKLEGLILNYIVLDEEKKIYVGDLEHSEEQIIEIPNIDISIKPTYQKKRGNYKINLELKDKNNKRIDIRTKSFDLNRILEKIEIEGVDPKSVLRGLPFRVNFQCNFSGVPFPITLDFKKKHETETEWEVLHHSKLKSYTPLSSQIYPIMINNKERRGIYELALDIIKDKEIIESIKTTIFVEKTLKSIQVKKDEINPNIILKNPYSDLMSGKLCISLDSVGETRKDYKYNINVKDGQILKFPIKEIKINELSKKEYTITARWNLITPKQNAIPEMIEKLIKTIQLDDKPEKERKSIRIKYDPEPEEDIIAFFSPEEKIIYLNVLHPLFERLDTPDGLDKEVWYKGLGILLYYCFEERLKGRDKNWWDFEEKFYSIIKKFETKMNGG